MTNLDLNPRARMAESLIPPAFRENPSARRIIMSTYEKAKREGVWGGYHSNELSELIGIEPNRNKRDEYELCEKIMHDPINYKLEFADSDYLTDPY